MKIKFLRLQDYFAAFGWDLLEFEQVDYTAGITEGYVMLNVDGEAMQMTWNEAIDNWRNERPREEAEKDLKPW